MDTKLFLDLVKKANKTVLGYKNRPKNNNKRPGGLIEFPKSVNPIIVGDLHGCHENLKAIIHHENNMEEIKSGKSILIILGDALHNDQTGQMKEMQSSLDTLDYLLKIMYNFPNGILYIRGNHDTFDDRLRKSGIAQGTEFKSFLLQNRNEECVKEVEMFFQNLPMFIIGKNFVITHAGPVRNGITREEIINIENDENKYMQLLWNRLHEFRGNPSLKEYGEDDIKATLEKLNMPEDTHFIVGHNPLWNHGDGNGVWMNVLGIKNHHIIYSNFQTLAPYFVFNNNEIKVKYAVEPKEEAYFVR